jgi:hypothetical protein
VHGIEFGFLIEPRVFLVCKNALEPKSKGSKIRKK